jgi:hypothetical protein
LIFEDLRHGHFEFIAASICLFAVSLMIVPRLAQSRHRFSPSGKGTGGHRV